MSGEQLDLFSASGIAPEPKPPPAARRQRVAPADLDDDSLIATIPTARSADGPALALEAGHRGLVAAVPALEALCRRFTGFGLEAVVPEQAAALEALATIGGQDAARAVARILARDAVQGPGVKSAMAAAVRLGAALPADRVLALLRDADPDIRADGCRCARGWPRAVPILLDLLGDLHPHVAAAAACALGRAGRPEARPVLLRLLQDSPTPEVITAIGPVADEECVVLLARIARTVPGLADVAREALEVADHPRAEELLARLAPQQGG